MASRGISDSGYGGGKSSIKEACARRNPLKRNQINYQKQLDSMQESLNKDVQENIFPYWRNHNSLKGNASLLKMTEKFRLVWNELSFYCNESIAEEASTSKRSEAVRGTESK